MVMKIRTIEDLKKMSFESFDDILADVEAVANDREEQLQLLTERVLFDLIQSQSKKAESMISKETQIPNRKREKYASGSAWNKSTFGSGKDQDDEFSKYYEVNTASKLINKNKKAKKVKKSLPDPPPEMPTEFKNKIKSLHGYQVQLVIQKGVFATDLKKHHDRLSMPEKQVKNKEFLSAQFDKQVKNGGFIKVKVIDPCLKEFELGFNKWRFKTSDSFSYVINSGWNKISQSEKNDLKEDDIVQVWSFLVNNGNPINGERLCFAIVKLTADQVLQEKKDHTNGTTDHSQEGIKSSSMTTDTSVHVKEDINGGIQSMDSKESSESSAKKNQSDCGAKKPVSLKIRFTLNTCKN